MPWTPLNARLQQLPLILAGPILRRTQTDMVTVWLALRVACDVTLKIYSTIEQGIIVGQQPILEGKRSTVRLGQHLHIIAVTARANDNLLQPGQIYAYNLDLTLPDKTRQTLKQALTSETYHPADISYFEHGLPTFALPPLDLNQLRIAHGSCRKPQGEGLDALPILDDLLAQNADNPNTRVHQLFFTGDQIYGDDVADLLLEAVTDAGDTLLGWEERLPLLPGSTHPFAYLTPKQLKPGQRSEIAEKQGGLTAGLRHKPERAKSHLMSWGEYCATYLFFWSSTLWPEDFPKSKEILQDKQKNKQWHKEVKQLKSFAHTLDKVRRLLANIPTYMIFDDHDISDDWYLNQAWCLRVLGKPLGKRIVQNGLLAYAIFQGWGNTPEQFTEGAVGEKLLMCAQSWSDSEGKDGIMSSTIARYLGLPSIDNMTGLPELQRDEEVLILKRDRLSLTWHYTIRTQTYEVIVLDTRTWRGYPAIEPAIAPPMLLSPTAFRQQIQQPLQQSHPDIEATLIIAPTNLVSLKIIDRIQQWSLEQHKVFNNDVGDGWNLHQAALARLLECLFEQRKQIIVLSGDIHYGSAVRLDYWQYASNRTYVLAQLTASAFSNAELKTRLVHTKLKSLFPEPTREWVGWNHPEEIREVQNEQIWSKSPDWAYSIKWIKRQPIYLSSWGKNVSWLKSYQKSRSNWHRNLRNWIAQLWRNRWLQEGTEVVGLNNFGLVSFLWSKNPTQRSVLQDLYWYSPWNLTCIVASRYCVSLRWKKSRK